MILLNNKDGSLMFPIHEEGRNVRLREGYNDIPDEDWKKVRDIAVDRINDKTIEEEWIKVKGVEVKKDNVLVMTLELKPATAEIKEMQEYYIPAKLSDIRLNKVEKILENTWESETLKRWRDSGIKEDVRVFVSRRLEFIKNPKKEE